MQNDAERATSLKSNSDDLTSCPCNACFPRKDLNFSSEALVPHPRELYGHNRLFGFGPSHIPLLPFAPIPGSTAASLCAPLNLHRASYPRAMLPSPERRYNWPVPIQDKRSALQDSQMAQPTSMQANSEETGRYWEQSSGSGSRDKPRRMRTVFTPQQLERLERHFKYQQYVGSAQRIYIAKQLGLSETQVKVWFQNRRIRWRKQALGAVVKSQNEQQAVSDCQLT